MKTLKIPLGTTGFFASAAILALSQTAWAQIPPAPQPIPNGPAPVLSPRPAVSYSGSVASGQVTGPLSLSLSDAIQRGLKYNLGVLSNRDLVDISAAERRRTLSTLLPNLSVGATQNSQQNDLVAFGLNIPGFPSIVGPFGYQNVRAYAQQTIYDRASLKNLKSASESLRAAKLNAEDARNLVVQAVSNAYLAIITDSARVEAIQAELNTAQALFDRASDQKRAGTVPGIDVLRAEVQVRTDQQRLLAQKNGVEKDKLALARAIGLPAGQQFTVSDKLPFTPVPAALDDLLKEAFQDRPDFRAAQANVRAAEFAVESARSEQYWPQVVVQADYGDVGATLPLSFSRNLQRCCRRADSHLCRWARAYRCGSGRSRAPQQKNAVEDLRGRIDFEVGTPSSICTRRPIRWPWRNGMRISLGKR